eukprot:525962-Amphidinium_carterae.1
MFHVLAFWQRDVLVLESGSLVLVVMASALKFSRLFLRMSKRLERQCPHPNALLQERALSYPAGSLSLPLDLLFSRVLASSGPGP